MDNTGQQASIRRRSGYTSIPNATMADNRLSIEARGLLALLMTFKDGWVFRASHLIKQCSVGRDKYYRMLGELKEFGYVLIVQNKTDDGKFLGTYWEIIDQPCPEKPDTVKPDSGKPAHLRETNKLRETNNKPQTPNGDLDLFPENPSLRKTDASDLIKDGFDKFWNVIWPKHIRKTGKKACFKVYQQACTGKHVKSDEVISPDDLNKATLAYIRVEKANNNFQYLKGPLPWLRVPGWEPFMDGAPVPRASGRETYGESVLDRLRGR